MTIKTFVTRKCFSGFRRRRHRQQKPGPETPAAAPLPSFAKALGDLRFDGLEMVVVVAAAAEVGSLYHLTAVDNICEALYVTTTDCMGRSLLGAWKGLTHAHWFCLRAGSQEVAAEPPRLLVDVIELITEEPVARTPPRQLLVELASNMADGVMQFRSIVWLAPANLGHNVRHFNRPAIPADPFAIPAVQLRRPYFTAQLGSTRRRRESTEVTVGGVGGGVSGRYRDRDELETGFDCP